MNTITIILLILFLGSVVSYYIDGFNRKLTGITAFLFVLAATTYFFATAYNGLSYSFSLGGFQLQWGLDSFRLYFLYIVLFLSVLALLYSIKYMEGKARLGYFYGSFLMSILGMTGVVLSRDFVSMFIFWEIMTWSSYLLIIYSAYYRIKTEGMKYMIFSAIGAYAMLTAIVFIQKYYGTLSIDEAIAKGALSFTKHAFIPVFLILGFAVKAAVMPLHVWAPGSYAKSRCPMTLVTRVHLPMKV